ncbi:hypothetical protein U1Q18_016068 [Sarracenia purpurea var. burkii]
MNPCFRLSALALICCCLAFILWFDIDYALALLCCSFAWPFISLGLLWSYYPVAGGLLLVVCMALHWPVAGGLALLLVVVCFVCIDLLWPCFATGGPTCLSLHSPVSVSSLCGWVVGS